MADSKNDMNHGRIAIVVGETGKNSERICSLAKRKRLIGKQKEDLRARKERGQSHQRSVDTRLHGHLVDYVGAHGAWS